MRLVRLDLDGFRGFPRPVSIDLDADAVLITGPNGTGKTSLFDAILWALTGRVHRLQRVGGGVVSQYSRSGQAEVVLRLRSGTGEEWRIGRVSDGDRSRLTLEVAEARFEGQGAELRLAQEMWPSAASSDDAASAFEVALTRSVYLQQDLVRQFLESDSPEDRFSVVAELVGAGRLNELQSELERARNSWTRANTELERTYREASEQVADLERRVSRLVEPQSEAAGLAAEEWTAWWQRASALGIGAPPGEPGSSRATAQLSNALREVQTRRRASERKLVDSEALLADIASQPTLTSEQLSSVEGLRGAVRAAGVSVQEASRRVVEAQAAAAEERKRLTAVSEAREELRALASLAIRHLDSHCPVCDQEFDRVSTEIRLRSLLGDARQEEATPAAEDARLRSEELAAAEAELARLRGELAALDAAARQVEAWNRELPQRARDLGIQLGGEDAQTAVESFVAEQRKLITNWVGLYETGERLALAQARLSESAQRADAEKQLQSASQRASELRAALESHGRTREVAGHLLEGIRVVRHEAVTSQIKLIEPLVSRIYARVDPHRAFKNVSITTAFYRRRGQIAAQVADPQAGLTNQNPLPVFSSSQLNALAVSVFLGINLGVPALPLEAAILDDPLQSLDDVNLLGLVDTLRRTKATRQLLLSTHDPRFSELLRRKLRPVGDDQRTLVVMFGDWTREGPVINQSELPPEPVEHRVAA